MIKLELDIATAAAVRNSLFCDTKQYTYDLKSCPVRVANIRSVIVDIDKKIEEELNNETIDT
tara:strand:- start:116 stop:301 length:186 start_codon:yes stop_codon:yes gene_type:complete